MHLNRIGDPRYYDIDSLVNSSVCPVVARVASAPIEKFTVCVGFERGVRRTPDDAQWLIVYRSVLGDAPRAAVFIVIVMLANMLGAW